MALRPTIDRLEDLRSAIDDAISFGKGLDLDAFVRLPETDRRTYHAIKSALGELGELGEATKRLPDAVKARHARIDWRGIAGMRDILVHEYFRVDLTIVWRTLRQDLPPLRAVVLKEIAQARAKKRR